MNDSRVGCEWAILCAAAQLNDDRTATIHRVFSSIFVDGFPELLNPLAVVVSLVGHPNASGKLMMRVATPEDRQVTEVEGDLTLDQNGRMLTFAEFRPVRIEAEGACTVFVFWNDGLIHRSIRPVWYIGGQRTFTA